MKLLVSSLLIALTLGACSSETKHKVAAKSEEMAPTQLDDLIRGEMAAVKSYTTVLGSIKDKKEKKQLEKIRADHENAVEKLKTFASADVKEDTETSGAWGAFASAWTGGAKLFGNKTALKALTQGEEHGITEYNEALADERIQPELKEMIKTQFLPKQQEHLKTIKKLM